MAWEKTGKEKSNDTRDSGEPRGLGPFGVGIEGPRSLKDPGSFL